MPDKPTIAELSATCTVNGQKLSPEGIRFDMTINTVPTVKVTYVTPAGGEVAAPVSSDVIDRIAAMQKARLAGPAEPDMEVTADDGLGGSMTFKAFSTAPILEISKVETQNQITGVGVDALLNALDFSFYWADASATREESGDNPVKPIEAASSGDIAGVLKSLSQTLVDNYDATLGGENLPGARKLIQLRHELNTGGSPAPLDLWMAVLGGSDVVYETHAEIFEKHPSIAREYTNNVFNMLTSKQPGFWNKIRAFMASFQMHYVPSVEGSGHFERSDVKVAYPDTEIGASVRSISVADGSPSIIQPGGVVFMMPGSRTTRAETSGQPRVGRIMAFAPASGLLPGFIHEEVPPFWLTNPDGTPLLGTEVTKGTESDDDAKNLDLKQYRKDKEKGQDFMEEIDLLSEGVLTELAEVMFKEMQLGHSTAVLTLPLDFNQNDNIGKRAAVHIEGSEIEGGLGGSFDAFITGVTHVIDLRQGKQLNSFTQVRCSHVTFGTT